MRLTSFIVALFLCSSVLAKVENITLHLKGVKGDVEENIRKRLNQSEYLFKEELPSNQMSYLSKINQQITKAVEPYGYFKPKLDTHIRMEKQTLHVHSDIQLGPRTHIKRIVLNTEGAGRSDQDLQQLLKQLPIQVGQPFLNQFYEKAKDMLGNWAQQRGYIRAQFSQSQVNLFDNNTCEILLTFDTGKRYYVGPIQITQTALHTRMVKKYLTLKEGQSFSNDAITESYQRLQASGYYTDIIISAKHDQMISERIPIVIKLKSRKSFGVNAGIGYGTDTGLEGAFQFDWRRINRSGHKLKSLFKFSEPIKNANIHYLIPGHDPITDTYDFSLGYSAIDIPVGRSRTINSGIALITTKGSWTINPSLNLLYERYRIFRGNRSSKKLLLFPQLKLTGRKLNNNKNPTNGHKLSFTLSGAQDGFLSQSSFLKASMDVGFIKTFGRFRILSRNKIGGGLITRIDDVPLSLQLLEGGPQSIRGFGFQSIGPGRFVMLSLWDIHYAINENWYIGGMFDVGNVYNSIREKFKTSAGISIMRKTPIGLVKIGIVKAFQKEAKGFRFVFSLGPDL